MVSVNWGIILKVKTIRKIQLCVFDIYRRFFDEPLDIIAL